MLMYLLNYLMLMLMVMVSVGYLTLFERKILGFMQLRKGPCKLGILGLLQPLSDGFKLLMKEIFCLGFGNLFMLSPMLMFFLSMMLWLIYPWINKFYYLDYSMIYLMLILSFMVYPIILIGWVSLCNYSILGSLRSISQMISFEILIFLMFFMLMLLIEDYSLFKFKNFNMEFVIFMYPLYFIFIISILIDLNRIPFDLIESESELVSGFNVEYFSGMFVMIFLSEYMNILFMSMLLTLIFFNLNYWSLFFMFIYSFHNFLFIMIRGILPRIRYDKLMFVCWMELLVLIVIYMYYIYLFKELIMIINLLNL
nr:TPA_asm: ND1 [Bombus haemorrhoidalis]